MLTRIQSDPERYPAAMSVRRMTKPVDQALL